MITHRGNRILLACIIAAALGVMTPLRLLPNASGAPQLAQQPTDDQPVVGNLQKGTPDYDTVLPQGKSIEQYGGWTRVSPPNRDPVYAYVDTIGSTPINVSQQPLPKDFEGEPDDQVRDLALGYGADRTIQSAGLTIYLGQSAKGPQSIIFRKGDLLILIKASATVPDSEWQEYIQSLS